MLGCCQHALYRGLLAGLQQQQQQCLQLEVLGLQAARTFFNDYKFAKKASRKVRENQRRQAAVEKVLGQYQQSASAAAGGSSSSSLLPSSTAAVSEAPLAAANAVPSSSPLQGVPAMPGSTAAQLTAAADDSQKQSWAPSWLSTVLDLPNRRRDAPPKPGKSSPLQDNAPDAAAAAEAGQGKKEVDGWESLNDSRNMTLDYYRTSIMQQDAEAGVDTTGATSPRPHKPPVLTGPRSTYSSRLDRARISHKRYEQHSNLIAIMSEADKKRIQEDPKGVKKDKEMLGRIARTAGLDAMAVIDLINRYCYLREFYDLLREYRDAGNQMPPVDDNNAVVELQQRLRDEKRAEELKAVLKHRDPANCQLRAWSHVTGPHRNCFRTNLPYSMCCGDLKGGKRKALG